MVQLVSYGFTTVENPLSNGGNFSILTSSFGLNVPSSGVCQVNGLNHNCVEYWSGNIPQISGGWPADHYAEAIFLATTTSSWTGPAVRCSSTANTYYHVEVSNSSLGGSTFAIDTYRTIAGSQASINVLGSQTVNVGDIIRLSVTGTTLTVSKNGSTLSTFTDAGIPSGSPGIFMFNSTSVISSQLSAWAAGANLFVAEDDGLWLVSPSQY